jgi:3',5'-nucleoside bisphosphate phosphatase
LLEGFPSVMPDQTFDLQSHSTHSDGTLAPREVVRRAARAGIELLALTDHDTVDGVSAAVDAAREAGIALVPAVELSSVGAGREDLHVLGYGLDHRDPQLLETLRDYRADRVRRIAAMADRLRELGFALALPEHDSPGRPHVADALLAQNADRLRQEGIEDRNALFPAYLVPGAPAYVARTRPTVEDAIATIHRAGGVAIWAHPFWDLDDPARTVAALDGFAAAGLDGVEAFYVTHTEAQTRLLERAARERDLLTTGSADFHGPEHERFNRFGAFETYGLEPRLGPIASASR